MADSTPSIAAGTIVLEKYSVVSTLGIGGMGLVVAAMHTSLGTPVAIKFLLPQFATSSDATRRFLREAQAASKIASEHIVRVFDTGFSQNYGPYIVMEYLEGADLSRRLRHGGPLSIEQAIDFVVQAALALTEAHANGIVHRDVKPANLYVVERPDGAPLLKVLDFGISKVSEASSLEVTKTQAILGSGLYMSPEQMKSSKAVDHRTDIYALGVTMFELLTRTQPFTAESFAELAIKVNMEPPTPLASLRADVSQELAEVIEQAYAKKADDRYQSMGEFALALSPWATPSTRESIEALARTETRRGRAPSLRPSALYATRNSSPSLYPPGTYGDLRIPLAPSLPTPSSVGVDTFGLSNKNTAALDPMGPTSVMTVPKSRNLLGVGVLTTAALAAYVLTRSPAATDGAAAEAGASAERQAAESGPRPDASAPLVSAVSAAPTDATSTSSSKPSAQAVASVKGAPTAPVTATAAASQTAPSAAVTSPTAVVTTAAPTATAPCKLRDIDGSFIDCKPK
jgi:serine/threonine-protein kinase